MNASPPPSANHRSRRSGRVRLAVEALEIRTAPAVFSVASQAQLAAAITASNVNGRADLIRVVRDIDLTGTPLPAFTADGGRPVLLQGERHVLRRVGTVPFRILHNDGATLTVERARIFGGVATAEGGGGVFNEAGSLTLNEVTVLRNRAAGDSVGGGVFNFVGARLTIRNSLIAHNHSATFGGGLRNVGRVDLIDGSTFAYNVADGDGGGGVCNFFNGVIHLIRNSTLVGNSAVRGGGICNHGHVSLLNCTIVGNRAEFTGGGIENDRLVPLMANCIVAENIHGNVFPNAIDVSWANLIGGNPFVGPLRNNGGPTPTMALLPNSPARGVGTRFLAPAVDQRGFPRPPGGPIDVGAFQASAG